MLQPVGKENNINFMDIDYDALSKEVKDIKESYNSMPKEKTPLKGATSGNLYKQKKHNMISFLEGNNIPEPVKEERPTIDVDSIRSKKLNHKASKENPLTNSSVFSATCGEVKDTGGPPNQMKTKLSNSIWNNNSLQDMAKKIDSKEKTNELKNSKKEIRQELKAERINSLVESLSGVDSRKSSHVSALSKNEGSSYVDSSGNMSIFDNSDFVRLPEKTSGEEISEKRRAEKSVKDESWRYNDPSLSSKKITNRLFDALMSQDQKD